MKINSIQTRCNYCFNSKDEKIKANARQCPGRFEVHWDNGKVRNVNCPILQMNRARKKEDRKKGKRPRDDADSTNNVYSK